MACPTWHLPRNPKTIIAVSSAALVVAVGGGGGFGSKWLRDPHRVMTAKGERTIAQHLQSRSAGDTRIQREDNIGSCCHKLAGSPA